MQTVADKYGHNAAIATAESLQQVSACVLRLLACTGGVSRACVFDDQVPERWALGVLMPCDAPLLFARAGSGWSRCVESGAKKQSVLAATFASSNDWLHGLSLEAFWRSQTDGVQQDLKTKAEIGELGYMARMLGLACGSLAVGAVGQVVGVLGGRRVLVQPLYGGDGLDSHKTGVLLAHTVDHMLQTLSTCSHPPTSGQSGWSQDERPLSRSLLEWWRDCCAAQPENVEHWVRWGFSEISNAATKCTDSGHPSQLHHSAVQQFSRRPRQEAPLSAEAGSAVGLHLVEALMVQLEQGALDLKHGSNGTDIKQQFKSLMEATYPVNRLVSFCVRGGDSPPVRCGKKIAECVELCSEALVQGNQGVIVGTSSCWRCLSDDADWQTCVAAARQCDKSKDSKSKDMQIRVDVDASRITFIVTNKELSSASDNSEQLLDRVMRMRQAGTYTEAEIRQACVSLASDNYMIDEALYRCPLLKQTHISRCQQLLQQTIARWTNTRVSGVQSVRSVKPVDNGKWCIAVWSSRQALQPLLWRASGGTLCSVECNDPVLVEEALGIEAARVVLQRALRKLFPGEGLCRHIQLLSDILTIDGSLVGIRKTSVLGKRQPLEMLAFEGVRQVLTTAALNSQPHMELSLQASVVKNHLAPVGTGLIETPAPKRTRHTPDPLVQVIDPYQPQLNPENIAVQSALFCDNSDLTE
jgi:hypothetical protein